MTELAWGDLDAMFDLAVVLNAAYFTFRHGTQSLHGRHEREVARLEEVRERHEGQLSIEDNAAVAVVTDKAINLADTIDRLYRTADMAMLVPSYLICIVFCILLFYAATNHHEPVSYGTAAALFLLGYSPIIFAFAIEVRISFASASIYYEARKIYSRMIRAAK